MEQEEQQRWRDYCLGRGIELDEMLKAAGRNGSLHLIIGDGFDPRALHIVERIQMLGLGLQVTTVPLPSGSGLGFTTQLAQSNRLRLAELVREHDIPVTRVTQPKGASRLTAGVRLARSLVERSHVDLDQAMILDISALPSSRFFPLLGALTQAVANRGSGELIVTVGENPELDNQTNPQGTSDPGTISGFSHGFVPDDADVIRIWAPVLGKATSSELEAIYEYLDPAEVYPILPFPARNPRQADDLVLEHREMLLERFETVTRNILYVQEANPFDCYRVLSILCARSTDVLQPIGMVQVVSSIHASKMLSVGVCLASIEHSIPIVTASGTHHLAEMPSDTLVNDQTELAGIWLAGTPYRP